MASIFDNDRFAEESNQPGINPAVPEIKPVQDLAAGLDYEAAAAYLSLGLDAKDAWVKHEITENLQELRDEEETLQQPNFTAQLAAAGRAKDTQALARINDEMTRYALAEKQGLPGTKTAVRLKQKLLLRQALDDNPWMASEIRTLGATYGVGGFSSGSKAEGVGPDPDAAFKSDERYASALRNLSLLGITDPGRQESLIRRAVLEQSQWELFDHQDKAATESLALRVISNAVTEAHEQLTEGFKDQAFDPAVQKTKVEDFERRLIGQIWGHHKALVAQGRADFKWELKDVEDLVKSQTSYLTSMIDSDNPKARLAHYRETQSRRDLVNFAQNNYLYDKIGRHYGVDKDPKQWELVEKQMTLLLNVVGKFRDSPESWKTVIDKMDAGTRHIVNAFIKGDPKAVDDFLRLIEEQSNTGKPITNRAMLESFLMFGKMGVTHPGASPLADKALKALQEGAVDLPHPGRHRVMLTETKPSAEAQAQWTRTNAEVGQNMAYKWQAVSAGQGVRLDTSVSEQDDPIGQYPGDRFVIQFDAEADRFRAFELGLSGKPEGEVTRHAIFDSQWSETYKMVHELNEQYQVRKRWGWWDDLAGKHNSKQTFIQWGTNLGTASTEFGETLGPSSTQPAKIREPAGTKEDPIQLEYDDLGFLVPVRGGIKPQQTSLIPGRGAGLMERQEAARVVANKETQRKIGLTSKVIEELTSEQVPQEVMDFYQKISQAETGGVKDKFIRTKYRDAPGGSTAYGPAQLTMGLALRFQKNFPKLFTKEEHAYLDRFIEQGRTFLQYGNVEGLPKNLQKYDYGGKGDLTSPEDQRLYTKVVNKMLAHYFDKYGGNLERVANAWRYGENSQKTVQRDDPRYHRVLFRG